MTEAGITYSLIGATCVFPIGAAYLQARYFFHFERRSFKHYFSIFAALAALIGTLLLQGVIAEYGSLPAGSEFLRKITFFELAITASVFWLRLFRTNNQRQTNDRHDE
jgi:hypothetical protein